MAQKTVKLTSQGLERIKERLRHLVEVKRPELAEYMGSAIADGDLRESAAYDEARLLQSANETEIADLEELILNAVVEDAPRRAVAIAEIGTSLLVEDDEGEQQTFYLVGTHEADVLQGRISDESPLGQALIGKQAGQRVKVPLGKRTVEYKLLEITFES